MKKLTILNSPIEKEKQFSLEREIFKRQKDYASLKHLKRETENLGRSALKTPEKWKYFAELTLSRARHRCLCPTFR